MKIATMATGGIGGFLAVKLATAGHQVATIARGAHLEAIQRNGLRLEGFDGDDTVQPWIATDDPAEVGPVDAIIFGVKGFDVESAGAACKPMMDPETVVVPFQNGVEAADRLETVLPAENVAEGVAQISTTISAPGVIKQTGKFNNFVFAERDNRPTARIDALRAAINEAGSNAPAVDDIQKALWMKFILFAAVSGITAAARCTIADVRAHPGLSELFRGVVAETAALARARNVNVPEDVEAMTWQTAEQLPAPMRASTAIDLEKGRPLEVEWISGAVVRLSEAAGMEAPLSRTLCAILAPHIGGRAD